MKDDRIIERPPYPGQTEPRKVVVPGPHPGYSRQPTPCQYESDGVPGWLVELGARIDPLVRQHHDRIAEKVRQWAEYQRNKGALGEHGPLPFREERPLTLEDRYALVAAVHQITMLGSGGTWGEDEPAFECDEETVTLDPLVSVSNPDGWIFQAFLIHVRLLGQSDVPILRVCVERVREDLADNRKWESDDGKESRTIIIPLTLKGIADRVGVSGEEKGEEKGTSLIFDGSPGGW